MSGLLEAARVGDLAKVQRLVKDGASVHEVNSDGENALIFAVIFGHTPVVHWLVNEGGARISDANREGRTAILFAGDYGRHSLVQWLLEEGGADITDEVVIRGIHYNLWTLFCSHSRSFESDTDLQSLLKVMVLFSDGPPKFVAKLSPQLVQLATQGRQIRALRPSYLQQQLAVIETICLLPTVLQSIVVTYAESTPEDMWTDWARWM
jgi:hypothetical protein